MAKQGLPDARFPEPGELGRIFHIPRPSIHDPELEKKVDALNESIRELTRTLKHIFGDHVAIDGQLVDMRKIMSKPHVKR